MIQARMRVGASWSDACILNLSTRGMLVRAPAVPVRGSYLEIQRSTHVIVARVIWSKADRFGVQTQDPVPAADLIRGTASATATAGPNKAGLAERRAAPRSPVPTIEASRWRARAMEFGTITLLGSIAAVLLLGAVGELLGRPLMAVEKALVN